MGLKELVASKNILEIYRVARYMYKIGYPIYDDRKYREIEEYVKQLYKDNELLQSTYDDDSEPTDIFSKYNIAVSESIKRELCAPKISDNPRYAELFSSINDYRTCSIKAYENYKDIYEWMMKYRETTLVLSLKVDGINTRSFIGPAENGEHWEQVCSSSRARDGEGWDLTELLSYKFPKQINLTEEEKAIEGDIQNAKLVYGEAYVERTALDYLRKKYGRMDTWKTPRSTALSVLRVKIADADYKFLKFKVFKVTGIGKTLSESLTRAKTLGFDTVPWVKIESNSIPEDYGIFCNWLGNLMESFANISEDLNIESDGVVAEIDNQEDFKLQGTNAQYNIGNIAIKTDKWSAIKYKGKVVDVLIEGQKDRYSVVAIIEPVQVYNGNTVRRVSCFNLDLAIKANALPGNTIEFEYKSASNVNLIYNKE